MSGLPTPARRGLRDRRARGQIIVIFAGAAIAFMALSAIVIDVSWYWSTQVRMQRAADAAALAGVVRLPGDVPGAQTLARTEASRNGYTTGVDGMTVTPIQDAQSTRRIQVTISGPINTFFARIVGLNSFDARVTSKAQYILPVPMGSPENYYGVFGLTRGLTSSTTTTVTNRPTSNVDSGSTFDVPTTSPASGGPAVWTTTPSGNLVNAVNSNNSAFAQSNTDLAVQQWGGFGLDSGLAANQNILQVYGITVQLDDAHVSASGCATSVFRVAVSFNNGSTWTTSTQVTGSLPTSTSTGDYSFGTSSNVATAWSGGGTPNIANGQFRVRVTADKVGTCAAATQLRLDHLAVRAWYQIETVTTTTTTTTSPIADVDLKGPNSACSGGVANCYNSDGPVLNPRGFWGTMNTQGSANVNGDAHQPYYDVAGGTAAPACNVAPSGSACYDPDEYYNYAIEMPQGATNGSVYIYDPSFCSVTERKGVGDRWFNSDADAVSSMYEVWDTKNTLYDRGDDGPNNDGTVPDASSGNLFRNMKASDTTMNGATPSGYNECKYNTDSTYGDGRDYHNHWYLLYSGMTGNATGPNIYRIHTTSTDPANPTQQRVANGENSFAIYASATGGTPKVYGLGAMQAFTPLTASGSTEVSEFYLAQIEKIHAAKTVEISLWDAGDTSPLLAELEILIPNGGGWVPTPVTYSATLGTTNSGRADGAGGKPDCRTLNRTIASTNPIVTYVSNATSTGNFNGCWLTIRAIIPGSYNADQLGWWKIRYRMNGSGTSNDVTTWKVQVLGNPVHLIVN